MAKCKYLKCKKCQHTWWERWEAGASARDVSCPECGQEKGRYSEPNVSMDGVAGKHSKALDITQSMLEKDYGMTNMKDNLRAGDVAAKIDNPVAAATQNMGGMFSGAPGAAAPGGIPAETLLAGAKAYTQQSNKEGRNPMNMFHSAAKKGYVPDTLAIAKQKAIRHNPNGRRMRP